MSGPLWIAYAWIDDDLGDFSYLVQELAASGVDATYDKIALVPGRRLWEQIAGKIAESSLGGWAYLLTPHSLDSEACREELAYALDRVLRARDEHFPLIGLFHGVRIEDVPPALRVRLCVSLASPNWKDEIAAALGGRPPRVDTQLQNKYVWTPHENYLGRAQFAVEVRPRFETALYWRFAVTESVGVVEWGHGPSGGGAIAMVKTQTVEGTITLNGKQYNFFGSGDGISPSISAYAVLSGIPRDPIGFGLAQEPFGGPASLETVSFH